MWAGDGGEGGRGGGEGNMDEEGGKCIPRKTGFYILVKSERKIMTA